MMKEMSRSRENLIHYSGRKLKIQIVMQRGSLKDLSNSISAARSCQRTKLRRSGRSRKRIQCCLMKLPVGRSGAMLARIQARRLRTKG